MGITENIIIENFFSIKHFEWDIKDFNVLTGGMASGKSICVKLVHFIEQIFHVNIFFASISKETLTSKIFYDNLSNQFKEIFHSLDNESDFKKTKITYTYTYDLDHIFDINAKWDNKSEKLEWKSNYIDSHIEIWRNIFGDINTPEDVSEFLCK